jgi:hypothetical protein
MKTKTNDNNKKKTTKKTTKKQTNKKPLTFLYHVYITTTATCLAKKFYRQIKFHVKINTSFAVY